ncbi:hypothetical protein [Terasakiispira papahanaumokuakeensis]|uniref:hypothetical protein n=1 Tax=Terasakiispira papahanaumokuakeensis TaxID=197479 RepID=UPI001111F774|nr:hypothetical protein [Terasakiispira papahanaumokuakeensis]
MSALTRAMLSLKLFRGETLQSRSESGCLNMTLPCHWRWLGGMGQKYQQASVSVLRWLCFTLGFLIWKTIGFGWL